MKTFDFDGEKYAAVSRHQKEWGRKLIEELNLQGDEAVLDLGCGDGALSAVIAALVPEGRVLGIDSSPGMIATARKHKGANLAFRLEDINRLAYECEFDIIFSNAVLHWVHDHRGLLKNCCRALKPGGTLRFSFGGEGNCQNFLAVVRSLMQEEPFAGLMADFSWPWYMPGIEEYRRILEDSPFTGGRLWMENADRWFESAAEITGWIEQPSLVPFLSALEEPYLSQFRDRTVQMMLARTAGPEGRYFETFRRINALLSKP